PSGGRVPALARHRGRPGEPLDTLRANADPQPPLPVWRALLARAYSENDQTAEARAQVDALRARGLDYPPNVTWTTVVVALSDVVSDLQDRSAAAELYERMRPIAKQADVLGDVVCQGSYGLPCGILAASL